VFTHWAARNRGPALTDQGRIEIRGEALALQKFPRGQIEVFVAEMATVRRAGIHVLKNHRSVRIGKDLDGIPKVGKTRVNSAPSAPSPLKWHLFGGSEV